MIHKWRRHWMVRRIALVVLFSMTAMEVVPPGIFAKVPEPPKPTWGVKPGLTQTPDKALQQKIAAREAAARKIPDVRVLSGAEMKALHGAGAYRNAYFSGVLPWQRSLRDVNLCNGNLFKSFTDIQVSPGKGAGLALQRTYNSNDSRIGPFGVGWTHAYEIRMEEAGNNNVPRTDFLGGKHTYHRDADGLYSPPPYLFDEMSSEYENQLVNGPPEVLSDTDKGMDGTVKHFFKNGNERDCDTITDRYGNTTTLTYNQAATMPDGSSRNLLTQVTDPSGRSLTFTWSNLSSTSQPAWRITEIDAPADPNTSQPVYKVTYGYYTDTNSANAANELYNLHTVTLDSGTGKLNRTTSYAYTGVTGAQGTENGLLASITDPLGHQVNYSYTLSYLDSNNNPYSTYTGTVWVDQVSEPGSGGMYVWNIVYQPMSGPDFQVTCNDNSGKQLHCFCDSQLRKTYYGLDTSMLAHLTWYDSANNPWLTMNGGDGLGGFYPWTNTDDVTGLVRTPWGDASGGGTGGPNEYIYSTYGPHGNVLTQSVLNFPGETTTTTYYDASKYFQKASVTDAKGNTSTFDYYDDQDTSPGNRGNVKWVRDARYATTGKEFDYTYNSNGQKASETNLNGVVTNYTYGDTWGNLTQAVQDYGDNTHLNRTTQMEYDVMGHVLQSTDPMGQVSTFEYNALGQATSAGLPAKGTAAAETISYTYGDNGRTESVTDNRGTTTMAYLRHEVA